jgi:hypothetical protein
MDRACAGNGCAMTDQDPFEPLEVEEERFLDILSQANAAFQEHGIPAVLVGGIASAALGRDRWTHDIDFFVRCQDRWRALEALAAAGFRTQETYPDWLFKGIKDGVLVDVLFRSSGQILDDEMLARTRVEHFKGIPLRVIAPEDLLIQETLHYWFDALGLIASCELDWDYLLRRAERREHRVLSLLVFAQGEGLPVPAEVIRQLVDRLHARAVHEEYLVGELQEALAQDPRTGELGLDVKAVDATVVLSGAVATPDRRDAVLTVAQEFVHDRPVQAEITVTEPSAPNQMEDVPRASPGSGAAT